MDYTKRYYLFGFNEFYPSGGFDDLLETFDTIELLNQYVLDTPVYSIYNKYQVFDSQIKNLIQS